MIKGLLRSNINTTAIDLNASLNQPLTIYDNYYYWVMHVVSIIAIIAEESKTKKISLTNLLHWRAWIIEGN